MSAGSWNEWLAWASEVLESPTSHEDVVDEVLVSGLELDVNDVQPDEVDQVRIARVMACLAVRRAALGVELADLARRRAVVEHARQASTGYLNAPGSVPMR